MAEIPQQHSALQEGWVGDLLLMQPQLEVVARPEDEGCTTKGRKGTQLWEETQLTNSVMTSFIYFCIGSTFYPSIYDTLYKQTLQKQMK